MLADKPLPSERPTGIGVAAFNMALALSRRGIAVQYVCRGAKDETVGFNNRLTVHKIRRFSRNNLAASLSILKKGGCELIHVHSSAAAPSLVAAWALGIPGVFHSHADEPLHPLRLTLIRNVEMALSQRVAAVSESTRHGVIRNHHVPPDKVVVVYNGVNTDEFKPSAPSNTTLQRYGLEDHNTVLLSVGRVQRSKGQWMVIECLPEILRSFPGLVYLNAGKSEDPSYQDTLLRRVEELGLTKSVKFLGSIPQHDLISLICSAALCIHPSTREAFPLAVLEEMACGKTVLAFDMDPISEIVEDGVDGLLVRPNNMKDLTESVLYALNNPELTRQIGAAAGTKVASRFTWEKTGSRLVEMYREILS